MVIPICRHWQRSRVLDRKTIQIRYIGTAGIDVLIANRLLLVWSIYQPAPFHCLFWLGFEVSWWREGKGFYGLRVWWDTIDPARLYPRW